MLLSFLDLAISIISLSYSYTSDNTLIPDKWRMSQVLFLQSVWKVALFLRLLWGLIPEV